MKKNILLTLTLLLLLLALLFSACGGSSSTEETSQVDASGTPMPGQGLSDSMHLLLGILSLADSDTPLTTEQATAMLPLWKAVRSLGESDTTAQTEIDALYTQIRGTLTEEQLTAIAEMPLDMQSMASLAQELGIDTGFVAGRGNMSPEAQATMQALRESGQMPQFEEGAGPPEGFEIQIEGELPEGVERPAIPSGGDIPAGGVVIQGEGGGMAGGSIEMFGGGGGLTQEQIATAQASGAKLPSLTNTISSVWLDALISMLEGIATGE
jgi:hypothetical protein